MLVPILVLPRICLLEHIEILNRDPSHLGNEGQSNLGEKSSRAQAILRCNLALEGTGERSEAKLLHEPEDPSSVPSAHTPRCAPAIPQLGKQKRSHGLAGQPV